MRLSDILSASRIMVDPGGTAVLDKPQALRQLASLLSPALAMDAGMLERLLQDREKLQSTGIGEGVAIPHASTDEAPGQRAALLLCPQGVPFDAVDGRNVNIIFGVIGPKRATSEHLKTLARISRLLRSPETRQSLLECADADLAFAFVEEQDGDLG